MYCPECGVKNLKLAVFCEHCGTRIIAGPQNPGPVEPVPARPDRVTTEPDHAAAEPERPDKMASDPVRPDTASSGSERQDPAGHDPVQRMVGKPREVQRETDEDAGPAYLKKGAAPKQDYGTKVAAPKQAYVAKKEPMRTTTKIILAELLLLVIVGFAFYRVSDSITSPDKIAYQYVVDVHNRDWNNVYHHLSLPETAFINKEMLAKGNPSTDTLAVENYIIKGTMFSNNGHNATVDIDYFVKGSSSSLTTEVSLIRQAKKKFLFFDSWKVVPDFVVDDYEVTVPTGTEVTLGGITLEPGLIAEQESDYTSYRIPKVFEGIYEVRVALEPMEEHVQLVETYKREFALYDMALDREVQTKLIVEAGDVLKATHAAVFAKKDFATVAGSFSKDSSRVPSFKAEYQEIIDGMRIQDGLGVKVLSFFNINAEDVCRIDNGAAFVDVFLDFDCHFLFVDDDGWGDAYEDTDESGGQAKYTFARDGEEWTIVDFSIDHFIE